MYIKQYNYHIKKINISNSKKTNNLLDISINKEIIKKSVNKKIYVLFNYIEILKFC